VIGAHHPFTRSEFRVHGASGSGDDQLFDSGFGENANDRRYVAR